jgi:hypothetical protein
MKHEDIDKAQGLMRDLHRATKSLEAAEGATKRFEISMKFRDRTIDGQYADMPSSVSADRAVRAAVATACREEIKALKEKLKTIGVKL